MWYFIQASFHLPELQDKEAHEEEIKPERNITHLNWFMCWIFPTFHIFLSYCQIHFKSIFSTYIYIYCHPQIDCFVVSQLFNVARHVGCFKLGLKPAQLYVRLSIIPLSQQSTYVSIGIISHNVVDFAGLHFPLSVTRVLNSFKELCITRVAAVNSFARVVNPRDVM